MSRKRAIESVNRLRTAKIDPRFREDIAAIADSLDALIEGASNGGKARARKLSKKRRVEIARKAANARWGNNNENRKGK